MNYKPFALILLCTMSLPISAGRGRKVVKEKMETRDYLRAELSRSRSRSRLRSRERELSLERDRERARAMSNCLSFGKVVATLATAIVKIIISVAR